MRVLWWAHGFWPRIGGVSVVGLELARGLTRRGHEIEVVTNLEPGLDERGKVHGIPIHRFPFYDALATPDPDRILAILGGVEALFDRFRPDLVHHHSLSYGSWFCARVLRRRATPLLVTRHAFEHEETVAPGTLWAELLARAEWVGCCSSAVREATIRAVPAMADRTRIVLNGLPPPPGPPIPVPGGPPRLLCLGRLIDQKGFDLVIDALPSILNRFPGTRLRVVGDGPALGALRERAHRLGMDAAIDFPGWIEPGRVPAELAAATAVVVPSRGSEAFCLVALQAAQMGRPVVATRVGGLPEVVVDESTGLLVEPDDPAALARALEVLLADPAVADRLGRAARKRALDVFGFDRFCDEYEELYRRTQRKAWNESAP